MDVLPSGSIFHELKVVHDTGYFDGKVSPEERWQQVSHIKNPFWVIKNRTVCPDTNWIQPLHSVLRTVPKRILKLFDFDNVKSKIDSIFT